MPTSPQSIPMPAAENWSASCLKPYGRTADYPRLHVPLIRQDCLPGECLLLRPPRQMDTCLAGYDALVELAVNDLDGVVDLIVLHADLVRDELHQQVDAFDERGAAGNCARSR